MDSCVGGQLREDEECPVSGVTNSGGRVWRKVPESDARSACRRLSCPAGRREREPV